MLAKLADALELARKTEPDTVGHRAAWAHAEDATSALVAMISVSTPAAPLVEAAALRVRRLGRQPPSEREDRRTAAKIRN